MKAAGSFFWRKLDQPGHDSARLFKMARGWRLAGAAVFWDGARHSHLCYDVAIDGKWHTRSARVYGNMGNKEVDWKIAAAGLGRWKVRGKPQKKLDGCIDVDLGFTPATHLIPLRRLALRVGQQAEAPAAGLSYPGMKVNRLPQSYRRLNRWEYDYASAGFRAKLKVSARGAVRHYPGLFRAEGR